MQHDITKCEGLACPLKENCLRFTLPERVKPKQDYFYFAPYKADREKCEFFIQDETLNPILKFLNTKP